jgi:hypothetical protein
MVVLREAMHQLKEKTGKSWAEIDAYILNAQMNQHPP